MSIYPSPDKLDSRESKYALVILSAKRARQIKDGARKLVETRSANPLTVALEEIAEEAIISREVEDTTVKAYQAALKPNEPSLEDIIGAGPVLAIEPELDSAAAQLEAFRTAEPDSEDDDYAADDTEEEVTPVDAFAMGASDLVTRMDEDDDEILTGMDEDEE